jgi:hypothetical protein
MGSKDEHKQKCVGTTLFFFLQRNHREGDEYLDNVVTGDETWLSHYTKKTPWSKYASKLYQLSDRRLLVKLVPTYVDRGCHVVSVTDPHGHILRFLDQRRYFFFQVAPQL